MNGRKSFIIILVTVLLFAMSGNMSSIGQSDMNFATPTPERNEGASLIAAIPSDYSSLAGSFVDKVVYTTHSSGTELVEALKNGSIDMILDTNIDRTLLDGESDIEVLNQSRNGYNYLTIDCDTYPLNITALRRATAFALDKQNCLDTIYDGIGTIQDAVIPLENPFTVEGLLSFTYSNANTIYGNQLLDDAGFTINVTSGYRLSPNGSAFDVQIEYSSVASIAQQIAENVSIALASLAINATATPTDFFTLINRLNLHEGYDMAVIGRTDIEYKVDYLVRDFGSESADVAYENPTNFRNATFDSWGDQLINSSTYSDVYDAAIEMQKILAYECPTIPIIVQYYPFAHRTDTYEGFSISSLNDPYPWWNNYRVHLQDGAGGPFGGILEWGTETNMTTFNFMTANGNERQILSSLYDSLLWHEPDQDLVPWLASSYTSVNTSTHRILTFNLVQNATWNNGLPLTAADVAFSLEFYQNGTGNPYGINLDNMESVEVLSTYQVEVTFNTTSYWHLYDIAVLPILPEHNFTYIGAENWNTWNPDPRVDSMSTSGPYNITDWVPGDYVEFSYNPNYFRVAKHIYVPEEADVNYELDETGNTITWHPLVSGPISYAIYREDVSIESDVWDGSSLQIDVDGEAEGTYNYTLIVFNNISQSDTDTVWVTVGPDVTAPTIDEPADLQYELGTTGHSISWHPDDIHPASYEMFREEVSIRTGLWNTSSETITVNVEESSLGSYNYTLMVTDEGSLTVKDTVFVNVADTLVPTIDAPPDRTYDYGEVGSIMWDPDDDNPENYEVFLDDSSIKSGNWNSTSENITIIVDGLVGGDYNYTLKVTDISGNSATDTVIVTKIELINPTINNLVNLSLTEGLTDVFLVWTPSASHPDSYAVYRNGAIVQFGDWNGTSETISIFLGNLPAGEYNYTIVVTDIAGNTAIDMLWIIVDHPSTTSTSTTTPTTTTDSTDTLTETLLPFFDDMTLIIISIGGIIVIIAIICMSQKKNR